MVVRPSASASRACSKVLIVCSWRPARPWMYLAIYRRSRSPNGPVDGTIDEWSCGKEPEEARSSPAIERRLRGWKERPADGAADPRSEVSGRGASITRKGRTPPSHNFGWKLRSRPACSCRTTRPEEGGRSRPADGATGRLMEARFRLPFELEPARPRAPKHFRGSESLLG